MLAGVENFFPPVPADVAVALGAFLAGRGVMNGWVVFLLTWGANVGSGAAMYALARRHGALVTRGFLGRHIFTPNTVAQIAVQYRRHGAYGIFFSRLLPIWRAVVMPFAGIAGVPAARALIPMALASGVYYGSATEENQPLIVSLRPTVALRLAPRLELFAAPSANLLFSWDGPHDDLAQGPSWDVSTGKNDARIFLGFAVGLRI